MSFLRQVLILLVGLIGLACGGCGGCNRGATPPTPVFGDVELGVRASTGGGVGSGGLGILGGNGLFQLVPSLPREVSLLGGDLSVDEVRLVLRRVDLKPDNEPDPGVEFEGPFVVNLIDEGGLRNRETPTFEKVRVPQDTYSRIRYRFDPIEREEVPDGLEDDEVVQSHLIGNTLVVEGSFAESGGNDVDGDGGSEGRVSFRLVSNMGADLKLTLEEGLRVRQGRTNFIYLALRLTSWLEAALERLQRLNPADLTDGIVALSDDSESDQVRELLDLIEDAIRGGTKFAESEDDQEFEEDEVDEESFSDIDFEEDDDEDEVEEETPPPEGTLGLTEVRLNLEALQLNEDDGLTFGGAILSLIEDFETANRALPAFETLGIPEGEYESLTLHFDELSDEEVSDEALDDGVVTDFLVDSTLAVVGEFLESPENDLNKDGEQDFIPFVLVSDDFFEVFLTEGITHDIGGLLFPELDPYGWFDDVVVQRMQALDPEVLIDGELFLHDSSRFDEVEEIVDQVEGNLEDDLNFEEDL